MSEFSPSHTTFVEGADVQADIEYLLSAGAVRDRSRAIFRLTQEGKGEFNLHLEKLDEVAAFVIKIIKEKYPTLKIPYHSRFNHFHVGGVDREANLNRALQAYAPDERARVKIDLVVTSVLLDAGAGHEWQYIENSHMYSRSEGLAVASYNMFTAGVFSSMKKQPLAADASGLMQITDEHIKKGFQVSVSNPLLGVGGRAELLHRLGKTVENNNDYFMGAEYHRPGFLLDYFLRTCPTKKLEAKDLLRAVLRGFGPIWPGRVVMNDVNLGDTWRHPNLTGSFVDTLVPLHKLSQWMTYSLLTPLEEAGFTILNLDALTGLAEYRNGGLMIDAGLISPKSDFKGRAFHPDSKAIIEWRALTVALLDELAIKIREQLKMTAEQLPLAKVLEGGTWWAGRKLAFEKRGGRPPFDIVSDGTVF